MNWGARTDHSCSLKRRFNSAFYFESLIPYKCNNPVSGVLTKIMLTVHLVSRSVTLNFVLAFHQLFYIFIDEPYSNKFCLTCWFNIYWILYPVNIESWDTSTSIFWYKCDKFKNTSSISLQLVMSDSESQEMFTVPSGSLILSNNHHTQWWINRRRSHWDWKRWDIYLRR